MADRARNAPSRIVADPEQVALSGAIWSVLLIPPLVLVPWLRVWELSDGRVVPLGFVIAAVPGLTVLWEVLSISFPRQRSRPRRTVGIVLAGIVGTAACLWVGFQSLPV